jgi:hypothetical protein
MSESHQNPQNGDIQQSFFIDIQEETNIHKKELIL